MNILGLIVEYNPLHNGHLHHIQESKRLSGAEGVVCVMSGNFIQRGEPAIVNKWARTRMALAAGVDLVIELPVVYAMASAEYFAFGAVKILDSLGVIDSICFGSESGNVKELEVVAGILHREPEEYRSLLKMELSKGSSYPAARQAALGKYLSQVSDIKGKLDPLISHSNNILGIEYIKAILRLNSEIKPLTITRVSNRYNEQELTGGISSATAIRKLIQDGKEDPVNLGLRETMPESTAQILDEEFARGRGPVSTPGFDSVLLGFLRRMSMDQIAELPYIGEGLENRIKKVALESGSIEELIENAGTRRYTKTRIQRCLFSILTGMTAKEFHTFNAQGGPQYARILGFNKRGIELLAEINKRSTLPTIVKPADFKRSCNPLLRRMLEIEATATDLYVLGYKEKAFKGAGQEYTQNIIRYF